MPPKSKDTPSKKPPAQVFRPPINESSLFLIPEDTVEGFQDRLYTDINWTLIEQAARRYREKSLRPEIPNRRFSEALQDKISNSILGGFLNKESKITLSQQWELLLPITMWDNEKFSNYEEKTCFRLKNNLTDNLVDIIKKAVQLGDRKFLWRELKSVNILRLNDSQMTELDKKLLEFDRLETLNLGNNYLSTLDGTFVPESLRNLELQGNKISDIGNIAENVPSELLYLGLARNLLKSEFIEPISRLPYQITVLDLSDNDIYHLEPTLNALEKLQSLRALQLAGNPCALCCAYSRTTISKLPQLQWLDCRELTIDRSLEPFEPFEPHPDDLRSAYFTFTVIRIMSAPQPPKTEKGAVATFHVELELPLLDAKRRKFLMYRNQESLVEMLPLAEDDTWSDKIPSMQMDGIDVSDHPSNIYDRMTTKNSQEIHNFTTFESIRVQWNKMMNFHEPAIKIFCPDLVALRDTFRTIVTVRFVYSVTMAVKTGKEKKSSHTLKQPAEQRVVLATIKCALFQPHWSQPSLQFHWDDSLGTIDAIRWEDGDLSAIQYSQGPLKPTKGKAENEVTQSRQLPPENLTCHFAFGIETIK